MIILDLTPKIEWLLTQQAQQSGLSVEHYLINYISALANQSSSVAEFMQGKRLDSFSSDPVAWQKAVIDE
ncbi:oligoendopeptidase F [Kingella kingae]|uniref:hypothetical protein n=1 Tax=Kingella kingae TaxID=504 RepID=UPI0002584AF5|nr:hypothetical protein [Kingella kingae]EIC14252.1 hypothetical protein KKB_02150 [Kingella kingae PYKK081]MBD3613487.1 oligoendopeptidase F [Kingella kingae]MBD3631846.1 oligoendopeptidase F [Kingella kingae]MBD3659227.1 oligoendopeptidase F [Kingella kingae]MDK4569112.1 oligoendopeptidase F [Kingella kingae]